VRLLDCLRQPGRVFLLRSVRIPDRLRLPGGVFLVRRVRIPDRLRLHDSARHGFPQSRTPLALGSAKHGAIQAATHSTGPVTICIRQLLLRRAEPAAMLDSGLDGST
jgi:hypothetical protein